MSEKSVKKWKIARAFFFKIFGKFTAIFAQTKLDQERLSDLAQKEVFFFGNLKSQAANLEVDAKKLAEIKKQIGDRKIFLAASTHQGEEEIILQTHKTLRQENPDLLTIIVIRHPNRADEVAKILDVNFAQRSKGQNVKKSDEIYLVDTLGELGIFYSLVDFTFIGGSLKEIGGHNPFEAIKLDAAVISGENIFNFREIYADLKSEKACVMVKDKNELIAAASKLILDKKYCQNIKQSAAKIIAKSENISQQIIDKISLND